MLSTRCQLRGVELSLFAFPVRQRTGLLVLLTLAIGCGGGGGGGGGNGTPNNGALSLDTNNLVLHAGEQYQFSATVNGAPAAGTSWVLSSGAGTITNSGLYRASFTPGNFTATVSAPGAQPATANIQVKPAVRFIVTPEKQTSQGFVRSLIVMNSAGTEYKTLLQGVGSRAFLNADRSQVFFSLQVASSPAQIYRINIDGSGLTKVPGDPTAVYGLVGIDRQLQRLVYLKSFGLPDEPRQLYSSTYSGTDETLVTQGPIDTDMTAVTSNGSWLYTRFDANVPTSSIRKIMPDGTGDVEILPQAGFPISNPAGTKFAYMDFLPVLGPNAIYDIWVANPDGSGAQNLTNTPDETEILLGWTYDGSEILYNRFHQALGQPGVINAQLWIMNADGTRQRMLFDFGTKGFRTINSIDSLPSNG